MDRQGEWAQLPKRFMKDAMVADVAMHVLARHAPDPLLVHFLSTDSLQHLYGPRSPEAYRAIEYVDDRIGRLLASLAGALDRDTVVFVVSDHGFLPSTQSIRPNVRLRQLGLLRSGRSRGHRAGRGARGDEPRCGLPLRAGSRRTPRRWRGTSWPSSLPLPGVSQVWTPEAYGALGLPTPEANPHAGDLLLEAAPGYSFVDDADGDELLGPPKYSAPTGSSRPMRTMARSSWWRARGSAAGATSRLVIAGSALPSLRARHQKERAIVRMGRELPGGCRGISGRDAARVPKYLGTHGQLPTHADNGAFFLVAGAGIRRGSALPAITSRDVAPTLAHLLHVPMPDVEGRVLTEALD